MDKNNKNPTKIHKKCKLFIKRLASKFEKGSTGTLIKNGTLGTGFRDAIDGLPDQELKQEILSNFEKYLKVLKRFSEKSGTIGQDVELPIKFTSLEFPYNLYLKNGHHISENISDSDRKKLYYHLLAKELQRDSSSTELLTMFEKLWNDSISRETTAEVEECFRLLQIGGGSENPLLLTKIMELCLSKIQSCSEQCLSQGKPKRAGSLATQIQQFLAICHIKYNNRDQVSVDSTGPNYEDLMAAYLSVYIDLCLLSSQKVEDADKLSRRVCDFTSYLLFKWPDHILDVLLQLSNVTPENIDIIMPLIRKGMEKKPDGSSNKHYLKYILMVRMLLQKLSDSEEIKQKAEAVKAPKDFLKWLEEEKPEILDEMPNDRHFKGRQISKFLLEDISEETVLELMDLLTDFGETEGEDVEDSTETEDKKIHVSESKNKVEKDSVSSSASLFYFDTKGNLSSDGDQRLQDEEGGSEVNEIVIEDNIAGDDNEDDITLLEDEVEIIDDSDHAGDMDEEECPSLVQDTIDKVQEALSSTRMTRHAKKLLVESKYDVASTTKQLCNTASESPKKSQLSKSPAKNKVGEVFENFKNGLNSKAPSLPTSNLLESPRKDQFGALNLGKIQNNVHFEAETLKSSGKKSKGLKSNQKGNVDQVDSDSNIDDAIGYEDDVKSSLDLGSAVESNMDRETSPDLINSSINSVVIPDSDSDSDENQQFDFIPEISSHLKITPHRKNSERPKTEEDKTELQSRTPLSRSQRNKDKSVCSSDENPDFMSPVVSNVKVGSISKPGHSLVKRAIHSTRLRTRSLTEIPPTQSDICDLTLGSESESPKSKLKSRKSVPGISQNSASPVVNDIPILISKDNLQQTHINKYFGIKADTVESSDTNSNMHLDKDVMVGGYSLRQTRKRNISEASHSSVTSQHSLTEGRKKNKNMPKTSKDKNIEDCDIIELSESSGNEESKDKRKITKALDTDPEISFNMAENKSIKTKEKKDRRKSEPGHAKRTAVKQLASKSRRYSLRH